MTGLHNSEFILEDVDITHLFRLIVPERIED